MRGLLWRVAGVEPAIINECPGTDRLWAVQLGVSLLFTFAFVFGLTYFSISYFITDPAGKLAASVLVAAVVTLFDRALFQSDWFIVAAFSEAVGTTGPRRPWGARLGRLAVVLLRLVARLSISVMIAYTLSMFAELAVFDQAISQRITEKLDTENKPYQDMVEAYRAKLAEDGRRLQQAIADLEREKEELERRGTVSTDDDREAHRRLEAQRQEAIGEIARRRTEMADLEQQRLAKVADAVTYGKKAAAETGGRPLPDLPGYVPKAGGCKAICDGFKESQRRAQQEAVDLATRIEKLQTEVSGFEKKRDDANAGLAAIETKRTDEKVRRVREKAQQIEARREELRRLSVSIDRQVATYKEELDKLGHLKKRADDPIVRIGVLSELRQDPNRGAAIAEMSVLIKVFICFLEIAPVLAKMFFFPPTVYAALVKSAVVTGQTEALRRLNTATGVVPASSVATREATAPLTTATAAMPSTGPEAEAASAQTPDQGSRAEVRDWFDGIEREFFESIGRRVPPSSPGRPEGRRRLSAR